MIGKLKLFLPDSSKGRDRQVNVQMTFGHTDLKVETIFEKKPRRDGKCSI